MTPLLTRLPRLRLDHVEGTNNLLRSIRDDDLPTG